MQEALTGSWRGQRSSINDRSGVLRMRSNRTHGLCHAPSCFGSPAALFQTHRRQPISAQDVFSYDVSSDGQRFLIITKVDEANAAPLSIHLNWASDMEK